MPRVPSVVVLRVRDPGPEATSLLSRLERELNVRAQAQTAGFVPLAFSQLDDREATAAVERVLDASGVDWRRHLELRAG